MEMHLFVALLLRMFDFEMLDQIPPPVSPIMHALLHTCTFIRCGYHSLTCMTRVCDVT